MMSAVREIVVQAAEGRPILATFDMDTIVHVNAVRVLFGIRISQMILSYDDLNDFSVHGRLRGLRLQVRIQDRAEKDAPVTLFVKLDGSADELRFQGKILTLTMGTFLPFSGFEGLLPGEPSRLDGRSARDSETIASVRKILADRRF